MIDLSEAIVFPVTKKERGFYLKAKVNNKPKDFYLEDVSIESKQKWIEILSKVEGVTLASNSSEVFGDLFQNSQGKWPSSYFRLSIDETAVVQASGSGMGPVVSVGLNVITLESPSTLDPTKFEGRLIPFDSMSTDPISMSFQLQKVGLISQNLPSRMQ